jgi:glycosyltransferase involved in cell wall biosynthesis
MPRIVFIWHAAVLAPYRKLLEELYEISGADLHLIVPQRWPEAGMNLSAPPGPQRGYYIHVLLTWFIGRHYLYFMPRLARTLKALRPDIVYCYAGAYWLNTFWTLWLVRRHLPHTRLVFVSDQTLHKTYPAPFSWFESWVFHRADFATSCDSEGIRRLWRKGFPQDRAVTVPLGFDSTVFYPERAGTRTFCGNPPPLRILYAGRLFAMKGVQDLIDACALLCEPYTLTIAGDGPERFGLEKSAVAQAVPAAFCGVLEPAEVARLMRTSDVLVLPSHTIPGKWKEQFGRVLVEAMASGCVPIGSDSGAIPFVIGTAGLIFPERDITSLAKCLDSVAGPRELLARLRVRALARANECYSWHAVAQVLWPALQHVLATPPRSLAS